MAHKALIGGTAYEIRGGKTLIGGTAYSIKNGKPLAGGTSYEINFSIPFTPPSSGNYLTFSSPYSFSISMGLSPMWDGKIYYSTDTLEWKEWDGITRINSKFNNEECVLYLCGIGNSFITSNNPTYVRPWVLMGDDIRCDGNIECLLDHRDVANGIHPKMSPYCFNQLFYECTSLIKAPSLPATTLSVGCYYRMFYGCTNLIEAPSLPATTLSEYCYYDMFYGCRNLTTIPKLPATTLVSYCYQQMFYGCIGIKLSSTQTGTYTKPYRIPYSGSGVAWSSTAMSIMFYQTGGTFTGTPTINTTYYLDSSNTIV